jgi:hypothetical protein
MLEPRQMRGFTQTGPVCRNDVMTLGKIFGILANSKNLANSKQVANVKGDKVLPKEASASVVVHHVGSEAPIVMGRSVSLHHKTKLHHVKVKPLDSNENLASADGPQ